MLVNFDKLRDIFLTILLTRNDYIEGVIPLRDSNGNVVYEYKIINATCFRVWEVVFGGVISDKD